jgi:cell division septation protein DedD
VNTARDGQFSFLNVPVGPTAVGVDVNALPVDFDPPAAADLVLELSRGETRRVALGLIPLGGIQGRVIQDANRNGQADANEPGIEGVLTLDNGSRSELAKKGAFRFDAVRSGDHHVELLKESLPDGAVVTGGTDRDVSITREHPQNDLTYLVIVEKRPEVRKVFPPRIGANTPGRGTSAPGTPARPAPPATAPGRSSRSTVAAPASATDGELFTIQVAALNDSERARNIVEGLKGSGFDAYLLEPGDQRGPYRVRVGRFESRDVALKTVNRLEALMGAKAWLTTVTAR